MQWILHPYRSRSGEMSYIRGRSGVSIVMCGGLTMLWLGGIRISEMQSSVDHGVSILVNE